MIFRHAWAPLRAAWTLALGLSFAGQVAHAANVTDEPAAANTAAADAGAAEASGGGAPTLPPKDVRAWQTGATRPDRLQHASLAFSLGLAFGIMSGEPAVAAGGAAGLALVKEIADRRRGGFDVGDLVAGLAGAACAALAIASL